jgi:branched-chain amino acid transport system ATP-binding protein
MTGPVFSVQHLSMRFGGLTAVDDLSFDLFPDQILAIIGPNGAGKTTVFNVVTGLYAPSAGTVRFRGRSISGLAPHVIAHLGIKRTFQQSRLFENLSVLDNVLIGMAATARHPLGKALLRRDLLTRELDQEIGVGLELLGAFSLELRRHALKRAGDLTPGDRRKLEICRALASDPAVLLLDEPAAGMDPSETAELMRDILKIRGLKRGIGIVLIEHDMSVVRQTADAVLVLSYGKVIAAGTFAAVAADPTVQEAYLGSGA